MPEEVIERVRGFVEAERGQRLVHLARGAVDARKNPPLHSAQLVAIDSLRRLQFRVDVHQGESRCVPDLVGERRIALNATLGQRNLASGGVDGQREAQRVGAKLVDDVQRIDHVSLGLGHLLAELVANESIEKDRAERHASGEAQTHHDHARHPEKEDVVAGDQDIGGVEDLVVGRVIRPTQGGERPERR